MTAPVRHDTAAVMAGVRHPATWLWVPARPLRTALYYHAGPRISIPRAVLRDALIGALPDPAADRQVRAWIERRVPREHALIIERREDGRVWQVRTSPDLARTHLHATQDAVAICPAPERCAGCPECDAVSAATWTCGGVA